LKRSRNRGPGEAYSWMEHSYPRPSHGKMSQFATGESLKKWSCAGRKNQGKSGKRGAGNEGGQPAQRGDQIKAKR